MINLILFLLISHLIGDYLLQSQRMSDDKLKSYLKIILHSLIYAIPLVLVIIIYLLYFSDTNYLLLLLIPLAHYIIDTIKYFIVKYTNLKEIIIYFTDQFIHYIIIYLLYILVFIYYIEDFNNEYLTNYLSWILIFIFSSKPANVTFRICTCNIRINQTKDCISEDNKTKTGAIIGSLERILITILLHLSKWEAIGLLFTGKSITRYNKIRTDEEFADYFLIGSIYSVFFSILIYYFVFEFLPINI